MLLFCLNCRTFVLVIVKYHLIDHGPLFQSIQFILDPCPILWNVNNSIQFSTVLKFPKCALDPITQIMNEVIEQHWTQDRSLGNYI